MGEGPGSDVFIVLHFLLLLDLVLHCTASDLPQLVGELRPACMLASAGGPRLYLAVLGAAGLNVYA